MFSTITFRKLVWIAPLLFLLHVLEEAPGFVSWFNSLVPRGITQESFLTVNAVGLIVTILLSVLVLASSDSFTMLLLAAWIGFLMLANGLFHLIGTVVPARYCPGVITGTALYLPYGMLLLRAMVRDQKLEPGAVAGAAVIGALPMLAHGYLIVFRGSRLF